MSSSAGTSAGRIASSFDDFVATRPTEEKWESISGIFVMQAPPSMLHSVIASNVERLLNEALASKRPDLIACREVTILMHEAGVLGGGNDVPDVAVLDDEDLQSGARSTSTCRLALEVVSPSDLRPLVAGSKPKIDVKIDGYLALPSCDAVLTVDHGEISVVLMVRSEDGWTRSEYASPEDVVEIPTFGLRCSVSDIHARTPARRAVPALGRAI